MSVSAFATPKKKGLISNPLLLLISFSAVFFPRIIEAAGAPSLINFAHFLIVPAVFVIGILNPGKISRKQAVTVQHLLTAAFLLLLITVASAFINGAGAINAVLDFLLLAEPVLFLANIVNVNFSDDEFDFFRTWIIRFSVFHIALALLQKVLLTVGIMATGSMGVPEDNIQGVFYLSGGGHVVSATVSMYFGIYYYISSRTYGKSKKIEPSKAVLMLSAAFLQLLFADAKQVMLVLIVAWGMLALTKLKEIATLLKYVISLSVFVWGFVWCMNNLTLFRAFNIWVKPELYGPDGVATQLKFSIFSIVYSHYESPLNWFLGIGPGHTVGRLGGWMLPKYASLLAPLGATISPASNEAWQAVASTWIGAKSSMFSPLFGWAGIWGDLGLLGLAAYIAFGVVIWKRLCLDDFSRFILLTMIVHGFIFSQLEEPGFMIYSMILIFLRWKEQQPKQNAVFTFSRRTGFITQQK